MLIPYAKEFLDIFYDVLSFHKATCITDVFYRKGFFVFNNSKIQTTKSAQYEKSPLGLAPSTGCPEKTIPKYFDFPAH